MKYTVQFYFWANSVEEVEANSPAEACEQAAGVSGLCHQCSQEIECEPSACCGTVVLDEDGNEVLREMDDEGRLSALEAQVAELTKERDRLKRRLEGKPAKGAKKAVTKRKQSAKKWGAR